MIKYAYEQVHSIIIKQPRFIVDKCVESSSSSLLSVHPMKQLLQKLSSELPFHRISVGFSAKSATVRSRLAVSFWELLLKNSTYRRTVCKSRRFMNQDC